jgi:DNA-binding NarL/FixJ family response regulator
VTAPNGWSVRAGAHRTRLPAFVGVEAERAEFEAIWPALARYRGDAARLRRIYETTQVPMVWLDNERRYRHANVPSRLFLRRTLPEFQAFRADDLVPREHLAELEEMWQTLLAEGRAAGTVHIRLPDGIPMDVDYCGVANLLPGSHLFVFMPTRWPEEEMPQPGQPPTGTPEPTRSRLTPREREVMTLIASGAEIATIAEELTLSTHTVKTHVRHALSRLGARNRAHAIAIALQEGEITAAP